MYDASEACSQRLMVWCKGYNMVLGKMCWLDFLLQEARSTEDPSHLPSETVTMYMQNLAAYKLHQAYADHGEGTKAGLLGWDMALAQ